MKRDYKILYIKLAILAALFSLGWTTYHFSQMHPLGKSFQLGILLSLAVLIGSAILYFILTYLIVPVIYRHDSDRQTVHPKKKRRMFVPPKTSEAAQPETKNPEVQDEHIEKTQEEGSSTEAILILPYDLSFLLAKESIENLSFGKIIEEDAKTGMITGSAGIGSSPQKIKLSVQAMTEHSTIINIISGSSEKEQSEKKNAKYIAKISKFLKKKERFYTE